MVVKLTFYGGVGEVGGNKFLLEADNTKILLDFGMSFEQADMYFSEFLQPRKCNGVLDFIELGLLPNVKGIYRKDYLEHVGWKPTAKPMVDGVLLSHCHADHSAYVHFLRKDIPIYCSEASKMVLKVLEDTSSTGFTEFIHHKLTFAIRPKKRGEGYTRIKGEEYERSIKVFEYGKKFHVGNLNIVPFEVDHALPGATAYIIETSEGNIVYTGDLRLHGWIGKRTEEFVEKASEAEPIAMLCEGTRIDDEKKETEEQVKEEINSVVSDTENLVVVNFPSKDIARLSTFHDVAEDNERKLVIDFKQATLLELLNSIGYDCPRLDSEAISLYAPRKSWGLIGREDYPKNIILQDYDKWERKVLEYSNTLNYKQIKENQEEYLFYCNYLQLKNLIDVKPEQGSCYIRSVTEPFDAESELDLKRAMKWLEHFNLPLHQIHCSGHANRPEILEMIQKIKPTKLYPIHTRYPKLFDKLALNSVDEIIVPEKEITYEL